MKALTFIIESVKKHESNYISYGSRLKFYHIKIKIKKKKNQTCISFPYLLIIGLCSSWCSPWFIYVEKRKEKFTLHKNNNITVNFIRLRHKFWIKWMKKITLVNKTNSPNYILFFFIGTKSYTIFDISLNNSLPKVY